MTDHMVRWAGNARPCGGVVTAKSGVAGYPAEVQYLCPEHAEPEKWDGLFNEVRLILGTSCGCSTCSERTHNGTYRAYHLMNKLAGEGAFKVAESRKA